MRQYSRARCQSKLRATSLMTLAGLAVSMSLWTPESRGASVAWQLDLNGLWSDAGAWSGGAVPTSGDDVTIDRAAGDFQITLGSGANSALSLFSTERLVLSGGASLAIGTTAVQQNTMSLQDGALLGGNWTFSPSSGGLKFSNSNGNALDGVTVNGDLDLSVTLSRTKIRNGLTLNGSAILGKSTVLTLEGVQTLTNGLYRVRGTAGGQDSRMLVSLNGRTTLSSTSEVRVEPGFGGIITRENGGFLPATFVNNGLISVQTGATLAVTPTMFENNGTIQVASGGRLLLGELLSGGSTGWTNSGSIVNNGGRMDLDGTFTLSQLGTIQNNSGSVYLFGVLNNTGSTLTLNSTTGSWNMNDQFGSGEISGGTVNLLGGAQLTFNAFQNFPLLRNVTVNGDLSVPANGSLSIRNGFSQNGVLNMGAGSNLSVDGTQTISSGVINLNGETGSQVTMVLGNTSQTLTIGAGARVQGGSASLTGLSNPGHLVVDGVVSANQSGRTLSVQPRTISGTGVLEARDGGTLQLGSALPWSFGGIIRTVGGTLNLGGTFTLVDVDFERVGGTVNLQGTLNNAGQTLTLDGPGESWKVALGSRITGGTINLLNGAALQLNAGGSPTAFTLENTTLNGDMNLDTGNMRLRIGSGVAINGSVNFTNTSGLTTVNLDNGNGSGGSTVHGQFNIDPGPSSARAQIGIGPFQTVTLASDSTIRGGGSTYGSSISGVAAVSFGTQSTLRNEGLISADVADRYLGIRSDRFVNAGITEAINGGVLLFDTDLQLLTNIGTMRVGPGSTMELACDFTTDGLGVVENNGGTVSILGELNNTNRTLSFGGTGGRLQLRFSGGDARILGGVVASDVYIPDRGRLQNVEVQGDVILESGTLDIEQGLAVTGVIRALDESSSVFYSGQGELSGLDFKFEGSSTSTRYFGPSVNNTMVVGATTTVEGGDFTLFTNLNSGAQMINRGVITASDPDAPITIRSENFVNEGTLQTINGGTFVVDDPVVVPTGLVAGVETGSGHSSVTNSGTLSLGAGSVLNLDGTFGQTSTGTLRLAVGAGLENYASLAITGDTALAGTLEISFEDGFEPVWGNRYDILTASTITGEFDTILLPSLSDPTLLWYSAWSATGLTLGVRHFIDINADGEINSAELSVLLSEFGASGPNLLADFNHNQSVDGADLSVLLANFGLTAPQGMMIPAPGTAVLLGLFARRSRRERSVLALARG